ncbi:hypothetical protein, partial [Roseivivax sp. CAU 1761]
MRQISPCAVAGCALLALGIGLAGWPATHAAAVAAGALAAFLVPCLWRRVGWRTGRRPPGAPAPRLLRDRRPDPAALGLPRSPVARRRA